MFIWLFGESRLFYGSSKGFYFVLRGSKGVLCGSVWFLEPRTTMPLKTLIWLLQCPLTLKQQQVFSRRFPPMTRLPKTLNPSAAALPTPPWSTVEPCQTEFSLCCLLCVQVTDLPKRNQSSLLFLHSIMVANTASATSSSTRVSASRQHISTARFLCMSVTHTPDQHTNTLLIQSESSFSRGGADECLPHLHLPAS